jgi:tetratricopeptide (TPR) repeat protein
MKSTRARKEQPRAPRRWRTPPPLTRGSETLEGMDILREIGGEAGILLWQSYRNVMFWATAEPADRGKLFSPDAGRKRLAELLAADIPTDLVDSLVAVGRMLSAPDTTTGDALAEACRAIAQWADHHGYESTSLSFTQAAAVSSPRNAAIAYEVGKLARRRGDIARAETWFRHAIMIARQTGDWDSYVQAYLGLGTLSMLRGNYPQAHRMHIKGLRAARRKGLIKLQGAALHDLFVIATETNRPTTALDYARGAFKAYGPEHPNLPKLAHDVAYFWMNEGYFERALPVFQALVPYFALPEALILHAHIARAAGGTGDRELFRREWNEAIRLSRFTEAEKLLADSLLELGLGSAALSEWDRAEQVLERAIEVAERRGETMIRLRAEGILESARSGRRADQQLAAKRPVSKDETAADVLAERLIESLTTSAVPAHA